MKRIGNYSSRRLVACVLVIHGFIGTPIPSKLGTAELVIGLLLIWLVVGALRTESVDVTKRPPVLGYVCAAWLVIVPTIWGLGWHGHELRNFIRDFVPLGFLVLPLVLYPAIRNDPRGWIQAVTPAFLVSGVALSARYLMSGDGGAFEDLFAFETVPLNQCPSVIFTAVFGVTAGLIERSKPRQIALLSAGILCFATLIIAVMRAQIAIVLFATLIALFLVAKQKNFSHLILGSVMVLSVGYILRSEVSGLMYWALGMIESKNELAGGLLNGRDAEAQTILNHVSVSTSTLLLGDGWGAELFLPTASDVVRFTHQGALYFLWKTGVIGTAAAALYAVVLLAPRARDRVDIRDPVGYKALLVLATLCAFAVFTGIEMGYKMISYALLITLLQAVLILKVKCD